MIECVTFDYGGTLTAPHAARDPDLGMRPVTADAARTIRRLAARRYLLVLLSNTAPGQDRTRGLARAGILEMFAAVLQSHETGLIKPDPFTYANVCHAVRCPPERVMVVGNGLRSDAIGPITYGMHAALYRPCGLGADEVLPEGAYLLRRLPDLLGLLARIGRYRA